MDDHPSLSKVIQRLNATEAHASETFKIAEEMISDIVHYGSDPVRELGQLKKSFTDLIEIQKNISALSNATSEIQTMIETDDLAEQQLLKNFDDILQETRRGKDDNTQFEVISTIENYIYKCTNSSNIQETPQCESDVLITQAKENFKDPLTKQLISCVVKSKTCNHIYDRSTILSFLKKPKKCPYPLCQSILRRQDIVEDPQLQRKLEEFKKGQH